jgi:hypothetical protein
VLGYNLVEVWRDGIFIATITPGVEPISTLHLVTKHEVLLEPHAKDFTELNVIKLRIVAKQ